MKALSAVLSLIFLASCKPSGLVWKKDRLEANLGPEETTRSFEFSFTNRYPGPVRIVSVTPSCSSCSRVEWSPAPVASGSESSVKLTLDGAGKSGWVETSAMVCDDRGGAQELQLRVNVPQVVVLEPGYLRWRLGDQTRQKVKIWVNPDYPGELTGIAEPKKIAGLAPALRRIDPQGHWELELSPPKVKGRWQGKIEIFTSRPEPRWKTLSLPLFVEPS